MKTFEVNGKKYKSKEFDFNLVCDLEDMRVSLEDMRNKSMSLIRAYFGICAGLDREKSGAELQAHIIKNRNFESITDVMSSEMESSDFFRSLSKRTETEDLENSEEKTAETEQKKEDWEE